jgi:plasmid maintenance system antidote protein VapI
MKNKKPVRQDLKKVDEEFNHELHMLMNKFLYEVYKHILNNRLSKSALASCLQVSPGYLSQIFHNKKPLTFEMLVKMQRTLNIEFEIKAQTPS